MTHLVQKLGLLGSRQYIQLGSGHTPQLPNELAVPLVQVVQ